jgi:putative transposase
MTKTSKLPTRQTNRLQGYDYALPGGYFVTIVTKGRKMLFVDVTAGEVALNVVGEMIRTEWSAISVRFPNVLLDEYIVIPNHFHAILFLTETGERAATRAAPRLGQTETGGTGLVPARRQPVAKAAPTLGQVIGAFKSITTNHYIKNVNEENWLPLTEHMWQRSFHDRVIRDEEELHRLREYVCFNAAKWPQDEENPLNVDG